MRADSRRFELQQQVEGLIDFILYKPETEPNILELKSLLEALGDVIHTISSYQDVNEISSKNESGIVYISIVGKAFNTKKLKLKFLQCILDIDPAQLVDEYHSTPDYTLRLQTPLRIAIKNRNAEMVEDVLNHPIFNAYTNDMAAASCDQLFRAYMWALCWFDITEQALWHITSRHGCTREENSTMFKNQQKILDMLLTRCKAAMVIASSQDLNTLPKQIMQTFLFDGIAGESFTIHDNKPHLLETQARNMVEICKAYYKTPQELEVATNTGCLVGPETITQIINLRLFLSESETDENIQKFQESLNALSTGLGHNLFTDFLSITGRSSADNNFYNFTLCKFATDKKKTRFANCISEAEKASEVIHGQTADARRLQQHIALAPSAYQHYSSSAISAFGIAALAIFYYLYTELCNNIINDTYESYGPGRGR